MDLALRLAISEARHSKGKGKPQRIGQAGNEDLFDTRKEEKNGDYEGPKLPRPGLCSRGLAKRSVAPLDHPSSIEPLL